MKEPFMAWRETVTPERSEKLVDQLRTLQRTSSDIEAAIIVSVDGLTIASALPEYLEEDRISAMSAAMLSLSQSISGELKKGTLEQVYIKGTEGFVVLMAVGSDAVLTVFASKNAKLGLVIFEMKRAAEELLNLLKD
ncbi:MAG: roadblock/LC7 domain-containing protein [Anaerolineaceae bacterium]